MKPLIEKSNQEQMNSRESQLGENVANRFLMNGLIRVGRTVNDLVMPNGISARYPWMMYVSTV